MSVGELKCLRRGRVPLIAGLSRKSDLVPPRLERNLQLMKSNYAASLVERINRTTVRSTRQVIVTSQRLFRKSQDQPDEAQDQRKTNRKTQSTKRRVIRDTAQPARRTRKGTRRAAEKKRRYRGHRVIAPGENRQNPPQPSQSRAAMPRLSGSCHGFHARIQAFRHPLHSTPPQPVRAHKNKSARDRRLIHPGSALVVLRLCVQQHVQQ